MKRNLKATMSCNANNASTYVGSILQAHLIGLLGKETEEENQVNAKNDEKPET